MMNETFDHSFKNLNCAAKVILAFGFILNYIEDEGFRILYTHKNNSLVGWSTFLCTMDHLAKLNDNYKKTDVIDSCRRIRLITKWKFQRRTYGLQGRWFTPFTDEKRHNQLFHVLREHKTTI